MTMAWLGERGRAASPLPGPGVHGLRQRMLKGLPSDGAERPKTWSTAGPMRRSRIQWSDVTNDDDGIARVVCPGFCDVPKVIACCGEAAADGLIGLHWQVLDPAPIRALDVCPEPYGATHREL